MNIVFSGGGTAGHVVPNIALAEILCQKHKCHYVGTDGMEHKLIAPLVGKTFVEFHKIDACKFQRKLSFSNLKLPFALAKSVAQCKKVLTRLAPCVVFCKGGYVSLPVAIASKQLKQPLIVHESDTSIGLANKICFSFADLNLTAFPQKKGVTVGAILKNDLKNGDRQKGLKLMNFDGKKPILLVLGGSLGSVALNNALRNCPDLAKTFDVFVICGKGKRVDFNFHQTEYCFDMPSLYTCCTVAVCRGGANTLCELTEMQIPFVCVPLEKSSRGEQLDNAKLFCQQKGCGILLRESSLDFDLQNETHTLLKNLDWYKQNQKKFCVNGTNTVVKLIEQTISKYQ